MRRVAATIAASRSGASTVDVMRAAMAPAGARSPPSGRVSRTRMRGRDHRLERRAARRRNRSRARHARCLRAPTPLSRRRRAMRRHSAARHRAADLSVPASTSRRIAALAAASPPWRSLAFRLRNPEIRRVHVKRRRPRRSGTRTPSCARSSTSRRSRPRRARPTRAPIPAAASARASSSVSSECGTPTSWRRAPAGFVSGPSRLNAVRTPSSRRTGSGVPHRGMKRRRKEERDADSLERSFDDGRVRPDVDAERLVHVGAAALARDRPVAVLRHAQSGSRGHECRGGRDIERAGAIAAGAARVEDIVERPRQLHRIGAHRPRQADDLGRTLALHREADQQRGDLRRRRLAAHDRAHRLGGLIDRQVLAPHQFFQQRRNDHRS